MCYAKPGPRCSGHTLLERGRALLESREATDEFQRAEAAARTQLQPDGTYPEHVVADMLDKKARVEITGRKLRAITREWRTTRHGIESSNLDTAIALGRVDPEQLARVEAAHHRLEAALTQIAAVERAGGEPSEALVAERKAAFSDHAAQAREAAVVWHSEVARTINADPTAFGLSEPVHTDDIDPTNTAHVAAMGATATRLRNEAVTDARAGRPARIPDPERFRKAAINLQSAATDRARRLHLFRTEGATKHLAKAGQDGWEPMEMHYDWAEDKAATVARQAHPDTHHVDSHGESYGDHAESRNRRISQREKSREEAAEWARQMEADAKPAWDSPDAAEPTGADLTRMEQLLGVLRRDPEMAAVV